MLAGAETRLRSECLMSGSLNRSQRWETPVQQSVSGTGHCGRWSSGVNTPVMVPSGGVREGPQRPSL